MKAMATKNEVEYIGAEERFYLQHLSAAAKGAVMFSGHRHFVLSKTGDQHLS